MSYSVTKNTYLLTAASILQKVISFAYFTLVARYVGVGNTGQYFFAIAFTTIFTVVADFGLSPVLTREAARSRERSKEYLSVVFWIKFVFGVAAYFLLIFSANILGYPVSVKLLIYISGITMFFDNLHSAFYAIFRAHKNLFFESIGIVGSQFLTLLIGTAALISGWPLYWLILAYTIPSFCNVIYSGLAVRNVLKIMPGWRVDFKILRTFLLFALPFALAGILSRLYSYTDSLIMSKMLDVKSLGWWSVPYKITFAFQFIPVALSASIYPAMSSVASADGVRLGAIFEKSWRYLLIIVLPLSLGLFVLSRPVILFLYREEFLPAVPVLRILLFSLIFGFLSFVSGAFLNATDHQKIQTAILGSALFVNIICNILFLPRYGIIGAAVASLISNAVLAMAGYWLSSRYAPINHRRIFVYLNQALWPALFMAGAVYWLSARVNFLFAIPAGVVIYVALLFLTGGMSRALIKETLIKMKN